MVLPGSCPGVMESLLGSLADSVPCCFRLTRLVAGPCGHLWRMLEPGPEPPQHMGSEGPLYYSTGGPWQGGYWHRLGEGRARGAEAGASLAPTWGLVARAHLLTKGLCSLPQTLAHPCPAAFYTPAPWNWPELGPASLRDRATCTSPGHLMDVGAEAQVVVPAPQPGPAEPGTSRTSSGCPPLTDPSSKPQRGCRQLAVPGGDMLRSGDTGPGGQHVQGGSLRG